MLKLRKMIDRVLCIKEWLLSKFQRNRIVFNTTIKGLLISVNPPFLDNCPELLKFANGKYWMCVIDDGGKAIYGTILRKGTGQPLSTTALKISPCNGNPFSDTKDRDYPELNAKFKDCIKDHDDWTYSGPGLEIPLADKSRVITKVEDFPTGAMVTCNTLDDLINDIRTEPSINGVLLDSKGFDCSINFKFNQPQYYVVVFRKNW